MKVQEIIERAYQHALKDLFLACAELESRGYLPIELRSAFNTAVDADEALSDLHRDSGE